MTDASTVLIDGPWEHRFVTANGARFHVAEAGAPTAPLVVLLHGFPQLWWAWRHQLPALAAAGYRVAAMDLRGAGASDKPPHGYDVPTLTRDVAGVIRSLGADRAVVVGHGVGGTVAWSMPALQPAVTRAVATLGAPHPLRWHSPGAGRRIALSPAARRLAFAQLPYFPERQMTRGDLSTRVLREWGSPGWLSPDVAQTYRSAARVPFAAHSAMETLRWLVRSTPRVDGQRYLAALRSSEVAVPVLQVHGRLDRCVPLSLARAAGPGRPYRFEVVERAGHFVAEEAPERVNDLLVGWLGGLPPVAAARTRRRAAQ
ncbi:alpha/beta fold hydrolase [Actinotalea sp. K2]|uniref:alpha/beta fold hydrolase n=1 Tax=Actinotalea sp. K2 TaxID=2939438 RepID=UPI002017C255|nr:alpha/beta hydrolase [Actinotalea sp. K2]MCL3859548.1 alpha/beta hydrolase [Actinotalea sp. K2]